MKKIMTVLFIFVLMAAFIHPAHTRGQPQRGAGMDFFGDALVRMERAFDDSDYTPEDAYYLGRAAAANILAVYEPYREKPELTHYLNLICIAIAVNSSQPILFNGYHVMILDSHELNAFSTPGGHIFITRGLVEVCTSEDMLAAIISHELAHIMLKHGLGAAEQMEMNMELAAAADTAAAFAGNTRAARRLMNFRESAAAIVDTVMINGYSRPQEFEADQKALSLLADAGYDPAAMLELLHLLQSLERTRGIGLISTHPSLTDRISNVESMLPFYRTEDTASLREQRFQAYVN